MQLPPGHTVVRCCLPVCLAAVVQLDMLLGLPAVTWPSAGGLEVRPAAARCIMRAHCVLWRCSVCAWCAMLLQLAEACSVHVQQ